MKRVRRSKHPVNTYNFYLAEIYFDLGDLEHSKDHYEKSVFLFEKETFNPSLLNLSKLKFYYNDLSHHF